MAGAGRVVPVPGWAPHALLPFSVPGSSCRPVVFWPLLGVPPSQTRPCSNRRVLFVGDSGAAMILLEFYNRIIAELLRSRLDQLPSGKVGGGGGAAAFRFRHFFC